ncbi:hypothetical protein [Natrinema pallidum]|uniref:hypothetical protein n=1 Tax=Natrinema pallidum TaxID=69527 RepID=UPI0037527EFF
MKRHVSYELEPADLEALVEGHVLDLDTDDVDSVSIQTNAHPELVDSAGGFRFVDKREPIVDGSRFVTDGGEAPKATEGNITESTKTVSGNDLESIDVTLEQSLTRSGDEEILRWTATADSVDVTLGSDTPAGALHSLADELEVNGGETA